MLSTTTVRNSSTQTALNKQFVLIFLPLYFTLPLLEVAPCGSQAQLISLLLRQAPLYVPRPVTSGTYGGFIL